LAKLYGHVHLGLLTDGPLTSQWAKISALGVRHVFDEIVVTGDWGAEFYKPNPRGFLHFETLFSGSRFVYVADNPAKDFVVPDQLHWGAIRVNRAASLHHSCRSAPGTTDLEVEDLRQVAGYCFNATSVFPNSKEK
jgi:putative hydrolase of the HAD superfamily